MWLTPDTIAWCTGGWLKLCRVSICVDACRVIGHRIQVLEQSMRELMLVRHGESEHHLSGDPGGWSLARLTGLGRAQAALTAEYLRKKGPFTPSGIIASDLPRAAETAGIIGQTLGLQVETTSALRESNIGIATGLTKEQAERVRRSFEQPALD